MGDVCLVELTWRRHRPRSRPVLADMWFLGHDPARFGAQLGRLRCRITMFLSFAVVGNRESFGRSLESSRGEFPGNMLLG